GTGGRGRAANRRKRGGRGERGPAMTATIQWKIASSFTLSEVLSTRLPREAGRIWSGPNDCNWIRVIAPDRFIEATSNAGVPDGHRSTPVGHGADGSNPSRYRLRVGRGPGSARCRGARATRRRRT